MSFWSQFWPAVVAGIIATVAGVALGVPAALALDRRSQRRRREEEQRSLRRVLAVHLLALKSETERNLEALDNLLEEIDKHPIGLTFETTAWTGVPSTVAQLAPPDLTVIVAVVHHHLRGLNLLMEGALRVWTQAVDFQGPDGVSNRTKLMRQLFGAIGGNGKQVRPLLVALRDGVADGIKSENLEQELAEAVSADAGPTPSTKPATSTEASTDK
jgi:hypothetical protein